MHTERHCSLKIAPFFVTLSLCEADEKARASMLGKPAFRANVGS